MDTEHDLQLLCEKYLDEIGIKYIHIENNQYQQKYRRTSNKKYKGYPDLFIFLPHGLCVIVELKVDTNDLTAEQIETIQYFSDNGYQVKVIYTYTDFVEFIESQFTRIGYQR